jgi:hypothetical protein
VIDQRVALLEVLSKLKADGSSIVGYGASGRTVRARQGHMQHFSGLRCAALRMRTPPSNGFTETEARSLNVRASMLSAWVMHG